MSKDVIRHQFNGQTCMLPIVFLSARTCSIERNEGKRQGSHFNTELQQLLRLLNGYRVCTLSHNQLLK